MISELTAQTLSLRLAIKLIITVMQDNKLGEIISKSLRTVYRLVSHLFFLSSWLELRVTFLHNISSILSLPVDL